MVAAFYNVLIFPILSLTISLLLSFDLRKHYLILINFCGIFISFLSTICLVCHLILEQNIFFEDRICTWIKVSTLELSYGFVCDRYVILMLFVVSLVSCLVHLYSIEYMRNDPNHVKFLQYLTLFTLAMYILITANNFVQMFIGWEGVGICSYLLINFWDTRIQANTSAMKAMIVNRIGDVNLLIAFVLIFTHYNSFDYFFIFAFSDYAGIDTWILIFLFIGAVGKSAQLFLHVWLPDAMEGPTPVSALIHAATMVTAGIYLIIRCHILFDLSPFCKKIILLVGGVTALFAGSTGMLQNDLKKVIAYSTCSQLGFMAAACGLGQYDVALFHLAMHAFFKALLFLSAGSIIHAFISEEQDVRRMGGLLNLMPVTYISMLIGSLALMGFPFTAGYYSKDLILESLCVSNCPISIFSFICCILASICTTFYSIRLIYLIFFTKPNM
jgi:proton-translocating NADH-quinone oxidoreductase chain L